MDNQFNRKSQKEKGVKMTPPGKTKPWRCSGCGNLSKTPVCPVCGQSENIKKIHSLKTWPDLFQSTMLGLKTFEVRKNDRDFRPGETLILHEYDPDKKEYTGREAAFKISYLLQGQFGLPDDLCVMSIIRI